MPGKIKVPYINQSETPEFLPHVNIVKFNTNLSIHTVNYSNADNLIVRKNDKYYKSIDGVIYTKDGKKTVRIPDRQTINIAEGCTEFTMKSILYAEYLGDEMYLDHGRNIKKIVFPKTVNKITMGDVTEADCNLSNLDRFNLDSVVIKSKQMSQESIAIFTKPFSEDFNIKYIEAENGDKVINFTKKTQ